jgi:ATP-binding cassette subfamily B protein
MSPNPVSGMKIPSLVKPYFFENRYKILAGLLSLITVDVLQLFIPRVIKWAVDDLTAYRGDKQSLFTYALYIAAIAILIGLFRYSWRRCLLGTSRRVEEGLRNQLLGHLQTLSATYYDRTKTGDLMAHATNDINQIRMAAGMGLVALNDAVVLGVAAIGFMAYINLSLTLMVMIPMPIIAIGTRLLGKKMHRRYQSVQAAFSDLTETVRERFAGIRIIKAHHLEQAEIDTVGAVSRSYIDSNLRLVRVLGVFFPMMMLLTNLSMAIVIYFGGRLTVLQSITPGDLVAFVSYLGLLTWPMMALGWFMNLIQRGRASLDRIGRILQTKPEITDPSPARKLAKVAGAIDFEAISFAYRDQRGQPGRAALSGIDVSVQPGTVLGIVGPPGSGKTTLLSLIPRLYVPDAGRVCIDGIDIRELQLANLRSFISLMPQEPFMFAGTIRENITFGNPEVPAGRLAQILRESALEEMIRSLPKGLDTVVGEKGVILSGGQKQRISLARCLLRETPVMLFDDPISQVDFETGGMVIDTIRQLAGKKTVIIVSHRLSAVRFADQIIVLAGGCIVESGRHEQLLAANRYYARTYRLQAMEEEPDAR